MKAENKIKKGCYLKDAFKTFTLDQDKVFTPEKTVENFKQKLANVNIDIFKYTQRIDNGRLDIPVYISVYGKDAANIAKTKKQMGKGATPSQAEASAVMELAERFSFFSFLENKENFILDTFKNIKQKALDFELIAKSVTSISNQDDINDLDLYQKIFENITLKWTYAFNLTLDKKVLIPFDWFFNINQFNGASAGNCREEAVCQGICEVIERDACALISEKNIDFDMINTNSVTDTFALEMLEKYKKATIKIYICDFSLNCKIPSIGVMAYDPSTFPQKSEIIWTAGTATSPQKALSRALSETAQLAGDFNSGSRYLASGLYKLKNLKQAAFIINNKKIKDISMLYDISDNNIKTEIERCIQSLYENNKEVLTVETTHPKLKIPAYYTLIPGTYFRERSANSSVSMFCAKIVYENNEPNKALKKLEEIAKQLNKETYYINFYRGLCFLAKQDINQGIYFFNKAISLNPNKQDAASIYSYIGSSLNQKSKYKEALSYLEKGKQLDSEKTDIYNSMGFSYFKLKEYEKAINCFKKVIELDPSSAIDYANIASNYRDMGNKQKAIEYYEKALKIDPSINFAIENLFKLKL